MKKKATEAEQKLAQSGD